MSLGLSFHLKQKRSLFPFRRPESFLQAVQALTSELHYSAYDGPEGQMTLVFCPRGEVELQISGDGLTDEAVTTAAGPGFHKAVVDWLQALQQRTGAVLKVEDETEYWQHRSWSRLEQEHRAWLTAMMKHIAGLNGTEFLVCWPVPHWRPIGYSGLVTPAGPFDHRQVQAEVERDQLADFGRRFWVWPNAERDAYFRRGIALDLMWNQFAWVEPRTGDEKRTLLQILHHLTKAREMAPTLPLPVTAWREALTLAGAEPAEAGGPELTCAVPVGYLRRNVMMPFPGGWEVRLPGTFLEEREEDGSSVWWEEGRTFRLTAFRFPPGGDRPQLPHQERYLEAVSQESDGCGYHGVIRLEEELWMLQGEVTGPGMVAVVTMTWEDPAHTVWAKETFLGIKPPR